MRIVLIVLALGAACLAAWFATAKTTFSSYGSEQLDALEHGYGEIGNAGDHGISHDLLREERRRRVGLPAAGVGAVVFALAAIFWPSRRRGRRVTEEERRLLDAVGPLDAGPDRDAAAKTLGVDPKAPDAVIEAAYGAHLAHLPESPEGLEPGIRRLAQERRDLLARARDTLLRKRPPG